MSKELNGNGVTADQNAEIAKRISQLRAHVRESFGKVTLAIMSLPRYRDQSLGDLQHLVLAPLIRDRVAIAFRKGEDDATEDEIAGIAIWAKVSDEVDAKIRSQIKANVWPIRLKDEDWDSGDIAWLFDIIAPSPEATGQVIGHFSKVVKDGEVRMHPMIKGLVDVGVLTKLTGVQSAENDWRGK